MIPPIPDNNNAVIPNTNNFKILGSSNNLASHNTPNNSPSMKVEPYNNGPLTKS